MCSTSSGACLFFGQKVTDLLEADLSAGQTSSNSSGACLFFGQKVTDLFEADLSAGQTSSNSSGAPLFAKRRIRNCAVFLGKFSYHKIWMTFYFQKNSQFKLSILKG
jgi:hypothetical protein